jgi:hypothetical protein
LNALVRFEIVRGGHYAEVKTCSGKRFSGLSDDLPTMANEPYDPARRRDDFSRGSCFTRSCWHLKDATAVLLQGAAGIFDYVALIGSECGHGSSSCFQADLYSLTNYLSSSKVTVMLTVSCVLRSGGIYTAEWVAKLQRGVARHLTLPHRFVCLSDVEVPCERIPLRHDWPGWWSKLNLFAEFTDGPVLYFDLDTIVVGSLDAIAARISPCPFIMAHEYYRPHLLCSTAMAWDGDYSRICSEFAFKPDAEMHYYDKVLPSQEGRIGDQAWIEDIAGDCIGPIDTFRNLFGERSIASWKVHVRDHGLDGSEAVVAFHGSEKPHKLQHIEWIRNAWT